MNLGPPELIILLVIVLLLFGGRKLPELARSLGQAKKEFEKQSDSDDASNASKVAPANSAAAQAVAPEVEGSPTIVVPIPEDSPPEP